MYHRLGETKALAHDLPFNHPENVAMLATWRKSVIRGRADLQGWHPESEIEYIKNVVTNCGLWMLAQQISSWQGEGKMTHMVVGTYTTAPTLSDPRVLGEVTGGRKEFAATSVSRNVWWGVNTWGGGADGVTSVALNNGGISNSANSGTLAFNHVQYSQTVLANSDFLRLELSIQVGSSGY